MLLAQGRGPRIILIIAAVFVFLLFFHLRSSEALSQWNLPTTTGFNQPATSDPPEQDVTKGEQNLPGANLDWSGKSQQGSSHDAPPPPAVSAESSSSLSSSTTTAAWLATASPTDTSTGSYSTPSRLPCQSLSGADDVLVVMRTGATEIGDKLPVHFNTTFQCYPHLVIYSDFEEEFEGWKIHDVLKHIPDDIKTTNDDFKHYQHILSVGRTNLDKSELSGAVSVETGGTGKNDNPGWRLDKWKFLPMINETLAMHPDKKWYVFVEPDSYLVWSNFLQWLPNLDPTKASYHGSEVMIGSDIFAHGGSVFLLSKPAMEAAANMYNRQSVELNKYVAGHWAGDCVLGKTLHDSGVPITFTWPQFQGGNPTFSLNWEDTKGDKKLWCIPALSYHHLIPVEVADFFQFEQNWIKQVQSNVAARDFPAGHSNINNLLNHRDLFKGYIMPNLTKTRSNWNAHPTTLHPETAGMSLTECKAICEGAPSCLQYALGNAGCSTDSIPRMGQQENGVTSAWMVERIERWVAKMDECKSTGFVVLE